MKPYLQPAISLSLCLLLLMPAAIFCQNISGEKIDVSPLALTVLKFSSKITHFEFDDKENYAGQVRNGDNSFAIRVTGNAAANTNLYINEGKRGHWFVINLLTEDIDLNKVKFYQDFSDLKALKNLVAREEQEKAAAEANAEAAKRHEEEVRKQNELIRQAVQDSIDFAKAEKERLARVREETLKAEQLAKARREQFIKDSIAAQKEQQARVARELEEAQKQQALEEEKLAKARADSIKAQKEIEALATAQKAAAARAAQKQQDAMLKARADSVKAEKLRQEQLMKEQAKAAREAEQARQKELARIAALNAQRIKDSLAALPKVYTREELWRKYPKLVFDLPPVGQSLSIDFFSAPDTLENYRVSRLILDNRVLNDSLPEKLYSNTQNHVFFVLESINFSGVNCFMRLLLVNQHPKDDYLTGPILVKWDPYEGKSYNLYPCYITSFPVLASATEREIVLVTRAVNIKDEDMITLHIGDRLGKIQLELPISGVLYNQQLNVVRSVKE